MASDSPVQALSITPKLQLYSYCKSSCSWRVRIALNLKGLPYEYKEINLMTQFSPEFSRCSPMNFVPALVDGDIFLSDSFAIILYLEEKYPQQPLLPRDLLQKSINLQAANIVCSNIQPLQNESASNFIEEKCGPEEKIKWIKCHVGKGFEALEKLLKDYSRTYATGDEIFLADLFLAPQIDMAINKFKFDMSQLPLLSRLHEAYKEIPAFQAARPEMQPDYVKP